MIVEGRKLSRAVEALLDTLEEVFPVPDKRNSGSWDNAGICEWLRTAEQEGLLTVGGRRQALRGILSF